MADQGDAALAELGRQLFFASLDGQAAEAARLLDLNAPIEHRSSGSQITALMVAAIRGRIEVVTLLANRGSDLEACNTDGHNALLCASAMGHLAVVQLLVERRSDIEARCNGGSNALMYASIYGHLAVVQYLASKGSSINTTNNKGTDACLAAALYGFADVVMFLISKGGDPRVVDQDNQSALTHFGLDADPRPSPEEQQRAQKQFLTSWKAGCHPDARWLRHRGLMLMLVGSKLRPMARDLAAQKQIQATMDLSAPLDPEDRSTPEANWTFLLRSVFGHEGIVRCIVEKIPPGDDD